MESVFQVSRQQTWMSGTFLFHTARLSKANCYASSVTSLRRLQYIAHHETLRAIRQHYYESLCAIGLHKFQKIAVQQHVMRPCALFDCTSSVRYWITQSLEACNTVAQYETLCAIRWHYQSLSAIGLQKFCALLVCTSSVRYKIAQVLCAIGLHYQSLCAIGLRKIQKIVVQYAFRVPEHYWTAL